MKYIPQSKIELKATACHSSRSWGPTTLAHVPNPVNAHLNCTLREAMPSPACLSMCHFSETTQKNGQSLRGWSVPLEALQTCRVEAACPAPATPRSRHCPCVLPAPLPRVTLQQGTGVESEGWTWLCPDLSARVISGSLVLSSSSHSPSASAVLSVGRGSALGWRVLLHYPHGPPE